MKSIKVYGEARIYHYTEEGHNFYILVDPNLPKNKERFIVAEYGKISGFPYRGSIGMFDLIFCDYLVTRKLPKIPKVGKPWFSIWKGDDEKPRVDSQYRPDNDKYELTVEYTPKKMCTFYEAFASAISKNRLHITATSDENLLVSLREELPSINVVPKVTAKNLENSFAKVYRSGDIVMFLEGRPKLSDIPTMKDIQLSTLNNELAMAGANRNRWGNIQIKMSFPSVCIEEYKRLANDIEYSIRPEAYERKVKLVRNKSADPLFDKLSYLLDSGASGDKIVAPYSDLVELGERFDLGEAYMLSLRLQWID